MTYVFGLVAIVGVDKEPRCREKQAYRVFCKRLFEEDRRMLKRTVTTSLF